MPATPFRRPESVRCWAGSATEMRMNSQEFLKEYGTLDETLSDLSKKPVSDYQERHTVGPDTTSRFLFQ